MRDPTRRKGLRRVITSIIITIITLQPRPHKFPILCYYRARVTWRPTFAPRLFVMTQCHYRTCYFDKRIDTQGGTDE